MKVKGNYKHGTTERDGVTELGDKRREKLEIKSS